MGCGALDQSGVGVPWQWGSVPLQVTLVKLNNLSAGSLGAAAALAKRAGRIHASTP